SASGLGLGLTVVKRLVELHGGTVSASSEGPDRGSLLVVRMPRMPDVTAGSGAADRDRVKRVPRHIAIVEDDRDFRDVLHALLESWGHRVEEAETGTRGLEIIRASRPDIAIVDLGLPGLD